MNKLYDLKQEIARLKEELSGQKVYWFKEEVQRDHNRLAKLINDLRIYNDSQTDAETVTSPQPQRG